MILPSWTNNPDRLHRIGLNLKLLTPGNSVSLSSPSHTIRMEPNADGYTGKLADVEQVPDHDLVLDVRFDQPRRMGVWASQEKGRTAVGTLSSPCPPANWVCQSSKVAA